METSFRPTVQRCCRQHSAVCRASWCSGCWTAKRVGVKAVRTAMNCKHSPWRYSSTRLKRMTLYARRSIWPCHTRDPFEHGTAISMASLVLPSVHLMRSRHRCSLTLQTVEPRSARWCWMRWRSANISNTRMDNSTDMLTLAMVR